MFRFVPTQSVIENSKKIVKKFKKIKKYHYVFISSKNRFEKVEKEKKKLSFWSVPTQRVIENSKKIKKDYYGVFSRQNGLEMSKEEGK